MVLAQTLIDILHIDDGIVNQRPDGNAHAAEGHRVDFVPHEIEAQHCAQQRQGYGDDGDERGAETAQEQEEDDDDEEGALEERFAYIAYRRLDEIGLAEYLRVHLDIGRERFLDVLEIGLYLLRNAQCVDVRLLGD